MYLYVFIHSWVSQAQSAVCGYNQLRDVTHLYNCKIIAKPLLSLVVNSQKCCQALVSWYYDFQNKI